MGLRNLLRGAFRAGYYALFGRRGVVRTVNGQSYRFSAHVARGIPRAIAEPMLKVWQDMTREADVAFEVGAHIGTYALICAREMRPGSKLFGFEPSPETYRVLCDTARVTKLDGSRGEIIPVNKACGATAGTVEFIRDGLKETNKLASGSTSHGNIKVEMVTLDAFCRERGVVPDVMKIDAEGAELIVLDGMRETLRAHAPVILIELHHILWDEFGVTGPQLLELAREVGYAMYGSDGVVLSPERMESAGFAIMQRPGPPKHWRPIAGSLRTGAGV
jgi:FkbM family methyltransferase